MSHQGPQIGGGLNPALQTKIFDVVERVVWTFFQAAAGEWIVTQGLDLTTLKVAATAGLLSVVKSLLGLKIGSPDASLGKPTP